MLKFEYRIEYLTVNSYELKNNLNRLGEEGWELVQCLPASNTQISFHYIFKRLAIENQNYNNELAEYLLQTKGIVKT